MPPKLPFHSFPSLRSPLNYPLNLEAERKFLPTPTSLALLRSNTGSPSFHSHKPLGLSTTYDIYYDHNNMLLPQGIYVRLRNGKWEAKVRQGGDFTNSRFAEYKGEEDVGAILREVSRREGMRGVGLGELERIAEFETRREEWDVEGFRVCVDETEFGNGHHRVGEVEKCLLLGDGEEEGTGDLLDGMIEKFMREHEWAFPKGKAMGKLSAYFLWKTGRS